MFAKTNPPRDCPGLGGTGVCVSRAWTFLRVDAQRDARTNNCSNVAREKRKIILRGEKVPNSWAHIHQDKFTPGHPTDRGNQGAAQAIE